MSSATTIPPPSAADFSADLKRELRRLRRAVGSARGIFALFPVEADLSDAARDDSLADLASLLRDSGQQLRILRLTVNDWNPASVISAAAPYAETDVVLLTGFENTSNIADPINPPPALAALNVEREPLEKELGVPLILWCPSWTMRALQRYAPDFFDHFSAVFAIQERDRSERQNEIQPIGPLPPSPSTYSDSFLSLARVESEISFYEQFLQDHPAIDAERINAQLGLADALFNRALLGLREFDAPQALYQDALEHPQFLSDTARAAVQHQLGRIAEERHQFDEAETWYRQSLEIVKRIGDEHGQASTLHQLGMIAEERRQFDEAETWYRQSLEIERRIGNEHGQAITLHQLGIIAEERRQFDEAETWYRQSLEIVKRIGDEYGQAITLHQLGRIAQERRQFDEAETWYRQSLEIERRIGNEHGQAITLNQLGIIAQERRQFDEAETWYRQSLEIKKRIGDEYGQASTLHQLGRVAEEKGELPRALGLYDEAAGLMRKCNDPYRLQIVERSAVRIRERLASETTTQ